MSHLTMKDLSLTDSQVEHTHIHVHYLSLSLVLAPCSSPVSFLPYSKPFGVKKGWAQLVPIPTLLHCSQQLLFLAFLRNAKSVTQ